MNAIALYTATVLMWIYVLAGTWQHIYQVPQWFRNPPVSFAVMRMHNKTARGFWIPLSVLFILSVCAALLLNGDIEEIRNNVLTALVLYVFMGLLNGVYFEREMAAFSATPADAPQTPELLRRTRLWMKWTTVRDVLQWLTAISLTIACTKL